MSGQLAKLEAGMTKSMHESLDNMWIHLGQQHASIMGSLQENRDEYSTCFGAIRTIMMAILRNLANDPDEVDALAASLIEDDSHSAPASKKGRRQRKR